MNRTLSTFRWGSIILAALVLGACGDGDTGPRGPKGDPGDPGLPGPPGSAGDIVIPGNGTPSSDSAAAQWAALNLQVTVTDVTINSEPVIDFTVTDDQGTPVLGLGNTSQSSTATVPGLTNLAFAMAKLVPGVNGSPNEWVSYIVTSVPTRNASGQIVPAAPQRPGTDNTGTLVDHGDGSYTYTFYRDVPGIKDEVDAMTVSGSNNKADLGDLTWEPGRVHRLTIQVSGDAPGTGRNTPNGVEVVGYPGVPLTRPVDVIYDFVPATGAEQPAADSGRDIVATAKCNECHQRLGGIPGDDPESSAAGFHGGSRNQTQYCVVCHTEQRKYGRAEATYNPDTLTFSGNTYRVDDRALGNMPNNIHKIHMGQFLAKKQYNYAGVEYNEVLFPQDLRNCTKCHDGSDTSTAQTAQGNNWREVPSRRACGACHDGINFATGRGVTIADALAGETETTIHNGFAHGGGAQADDSECKFCHTSGGIDIVHIPVTPPNEESALHVQGGSANTNAAWIASNTSRLPAGAIKVTYDIQSVSRNANRQPVMVFRILQNGNRVDFNDPVNGPINPVTGSREIWDGFMGSPSAYFVFAVPQDGITAPADFNGSVSGYLRDIWNGTATGSGAGTLTGPGASGYYTVTLTGVQIPDEAVMLTGGLGYSYNITRTLPLTQTNLPNYPVEPSPVGNANEIGGLIVIAPNVQKVATGYTGRRQVVDDNNCNKCHQELGTFTEEAFHGGQRNDGQSCAWCHRPNQTSSGWSADSTNFIHAIHGAAKRDAMFTWHASTVEESFDDIGFPGVLRNCEGCHIRGSYDFSNSASQTAVPNRLYRTVATGVFNDQVGTTITTYSYNSQTQSCVAGQSSPQTEVGLFSLSPYIAAATNYGTGFIFNAGLTTSRTCKPDGTLVTVAPGGTFQADPNTLVTSPIATACFACHDAPIARAHMEANGGSIYEPRGTALFTTETCLVCHDTGRLADIKVVHAK